MCVKYADAKKLCDDCIPVRVIYIFCALRYV